MTQTEAEILDVEAPLPALRAFLRDQDLAVATHSEIRAAFADVFASELFRTMLLALARAPVFAPDFGRAFAELDAVEAIAPCRMLRGALNLTLEHVFQLLSQIAATLEDDANRWAGFADRVHASDAFAGVRLGTYLTRELPDVALNRYYQNLIETLIVENPHAVYPTSNYRECDGRFEPGSDDGSVDAVMSLRTSSAIRMIDNVLDLGRTELRDIYRPVGRCIAIVDRNVYEHYGDRLERYFAAHGIALETLVYRGLEVDKGLATVERMLGDFKRLGISRNEPILIVGGGVIADTGGLACALYGRSTPYVMLATSIVSGIDAGPSPRTCCDGFGYKNLLGAYHPPVLCLTDRFFFGTLREGWIRHGVAEIVKIAAVRNAELFADLERARHDLLATRFGTIDCAAGDEIHRLSKKILGGAMRSYVESEYDNLYETHQCRPHAYGHTWSPGFEITSGLLHGHAVSIDMGFGAYLSLREGWIDRSTFDRILALIEAYGLSLWHDVLADERVMWESHCKIVEKRGGNLAAPIPRGGIGRCGYLNELSRAALFSALDEYRSICSGYARSGRGLEPLCSDVGLEDPASVFGIGVA